MSMRLTQPGIYADLGEVWLHEQLARLTQRYLQFGEHYRVDADALLNRAARTVRAAKTTPMPAVAKASCGERFRWSVVEAVEPFSHLGAHLSHAAAIAVAA